VPPSLLLLSRTLYLPETLDTASQIAAAVSVLPETAATGAKAKLGEREGKIENVTRLELIRCAYPGSALFTFGSKLVFRIY
jgi:LETM1 and EF-hand domain-containing protein 1, mitochondrial